MGYLLKESLKTLCGVNQWAYAVFWKFGCHNPKLLIWEDCYYETASFSGLATYHDDNSSWVSTETRDSHSSVRDGGKVHFLVNKMMVDNQVHVLGEGLVGRVAFTGNHLWVLAENYYREAHPPEVEKELCLQFAAGMQTIAVIPVLPHGVVQFGSSLTIIENTMFLSDVASLLHLVYLSELPKEQTLDTINPHCSFDTFNYISNSADPPMIDIQTSFAGPHHHTENSPTKLDFLTSNPSTSVVAKAEVIPSNPEMWSTLKFHSPSYYSDEGNISSKNRSSSDLKNAIFSKDEANVGKNPLPRFDDHLGGNDLFDVLGPDFKNKLFDGSLNNESGDNISAKRGLEESVSCTTTFTNPGSMPYGWFGVSEGPFGAPKCTATPSPMGSGSFGVGPTKEESGAYSHGGSSYVSQLSSWIGGDQKAKSVSTGCSKKGATGRKRLKPGENPRPRPKDRQLIQDRVKELREIVPNGAKCSIDSLLERTIKHMIFLQSVTKHADKLTQSGESKVISKDGGLIMKDNFEGGATWAYEVGSQSMVCPIIVEDLNQPRQMLVEMLCDERGLFLEIADIIRGLGLTILKGVMETRKDKIWARFVVEAIRDVTRIEIFISLVRLLEQAAKNGGPQSDNNAAQTPTAQQFHQLAPVSLTPHVFP